MKEFALPPLLFAVVVTGWKINFLWKLKFTLNGEVNMMEDGRWKMEDGSLLAARPLAEQQETARSRFARQDIG